VVTVRRTSFRIVHLDGAGERQVFEVVDTGFEGAEPDAVVGMPQAGGVGEGATVEGPKMYQLMSSYVWKELRLAWNLQAHV
jgi:hypothetical protein